MSIDSLSRSSYTKLVASRQVVIQALSEDLTHVEGYNFKKLGHRRNQRPKLKKQQRPKPKKKGGKQEGYGTPKWCSLHLTKSTRSALCLGQNTMKQEQDNGKAGSVNFANIYSPHTFPLAGPKQATFALLSFLPGGRSR